MLRHPLEALDLAGPEVHARPGVHPRGAQRDVDLVTSLEAGLGVARFRELPEQLRLGAAILRHAEGAPECDGQGRADVAPDLRSDARRVRLLDLDALQDHGVAFVDRDADAHAAARLAPAQVVGGVGGEVAALAVEVVHPLHVLVQGGGVERDG